MQSVVWVVCVCVAGAVCAQAVRQRPSRLGANSFNSRFGMWDVLNVLNVECEKVCGMCDVRNV